MAENSSNRRLEPRMLCAELLEVQWDDGSGVRTGWANLEDISTSGACVQVDREVPVGAQLRIHSDRAKFEGKVRYCVFRETGYFVGLQFEPGNKWAREAFRPKHLLDPRRLIRLTLRNALKTGLPE
jgi:hypothetical protein